jgi:hypothetical protein
MKLLRSLRIWMRGGFRGLAAWTYYRRELTKEELAQLNAWMNGVNRAMDDVNAQLLKMPQFK